MRSALTYTLARLLLFAVAFGVVYLVGARGPLAVILAFLISGLAAYVLLAAQRDRMSTALTAWLERRRSIGERLEAGAAKEDHLQEAAAPAPEQPRGKASAEEKTAPRES